MIGRWAGCVGPPCAGVLLSTSPAFRGRCSANAFELISAVYEPTDAGTMRCGAASKFCPAAPRTTRCSSVRSMGGPSVQLLLAATAMGRWRWLAAVAAGAAEVLPPLGTPLSSPSPSNHFPHLMRPRLQASLAWARQRWRRAWRSALWRAMCLPRCRCVSLGLQWLAQLPPLACVGQCCVHSARAACRGDGPKYSPKSAVAAPRRLLLPCSVVVLRCVTATPQGRSLIALDIGALIAGAK